MSLVDCFALHKYEIISIVGSGGKTTLLNYLAQCFRTERVLMTTTTKIFLPERSIYDQCISPLEPCVSLQTGITLLGRPVTGQPKLASPSPLTLRSALLHCDKAFIEADGAKRRPLKGWNRTEPVIVSETTMTIGVVPVNICGYPMDTAYIHRLSKFLALGDFCEQQIITPAILAQVISHPQGLFRLSRGRKILFLNQVETATTVEQVKKVIAALPQPFLNQIAYIVSGSARQQQGMIVWQNKQLQKQS
ncbi:selenium cofactor biosynthesis protein YqeC [Loigolactobacillus jiayinensis]|uniref:Selenium cofactor biosynthesis protein YqeC n=1 Tax=Loigolactobacillus jiayinensis TaxID=2486016 RepID=A0ABW1RBD6_9LACO|nr:selenium cofactor biosynthesis protein YqeC [Loigolactobacillus jiayinensis]